jgi:hypothetical protein
MGGTPSDSAGAAGAAATVGGMLLPITVSRVAPVMMTVFFAGLVVYWMSRPRSFAMDISDVLWRRRYMQRARHIRAARHSMRSAHLRDCRVLVPTGRAVRGGGGRGSEDAFIEDGLLPTMHATVIAISFHGTKLNLGGSINDAARVKAFFEHICHLDVGNHDKFAFLDDWSGVPPTDRVIRGSMDRLCSTPGSQDYAVCWWHYSGHGLLVDVPAAERARRPRTNLTDESIVPANVYDGGELITDGEMYRRMVLPLTTRPNVRLFAMYDDCYSGMNLRLKHIYQIGPGDEVEHRLNDDFPEMREEMDRVMSSVNVVVLSACRTTEEAAEVLSEIPYYQPRPALASSKVDGAGNPIMVTPTQLTYGALTDAVYDRFEADTETDPEQKCIRLPTTTWRQLLVSVQLQFRKEGIEDQEIELPGGKVERRTQHVQLTSSKSLHLDSPVFAIFDPHTPFP